MLDQLEQAVIAAEETRAKQKEVTLKVPDAAGAPSGRPRTSLHPPADRPAAAQVGANATAEEMPSFAAPTGPAEGGGAEPDWTGPDPAQLQQMQAMQEQMAAMQAQLQQAQALQQAPAAPAPTEPAAPQPAANQPLSGYRRPEAASPTPAGPAPEQPRAELGGARPSIEGSPYESVLADEQPAPFGAESSPFARLEVEQAQAAAERVEPPTGEEPAPPDATAFRQEPQRLVSPEPPPPASDDQDEPGEVDRVMLAKEFSGLLQLDGDGDED
jgi:translation initiation factor IF-2